MQKLLKSKDIEKSIVQIFSDHITPSYANPWSIINKQKSSGTGFCIDFPGYIDDKLKKINNKNKFIITNAHCVHNATYISIRKRGVAFLYKMRIDNIIYECDLAILSIDTVFYQDSKQKKDLPEIINEFWDDLYPLKIGGLPSKLDTVYVFGYPLGGYNISITAGSVNRIQVIQYFDAVMGIAIQIDAPINFGNSGGPVVNTDGSVIGVAFSGEDDRFTQNMGYIIPTTLLRYFLDMIKKEKAFNGLCSLGIHYQNLNNIVLREYLNLSREITGILIVSIDKFGSSDGILQKMDVITAINGKKIDNDGTMSLYDIIIESDDFMRQNVKNDTENENPKLLQIGEVAPFTNLISLLRYDTNIKLTIIRNKKIMNINIKLRPKQFLVSILEYQMKPSYCIISGLVFIPVSLMAYIEKKQNKEYISHLSKYIERQDMKYPNQQIIILSQIFTTELTDNYFDDNFILLSVNDIDIINLHHLYQIFQKEIKKSKYLIFKFRDTSQVIILNVSDIYKHHENIILENLGDVSDFIE